MDKPKIRLQNDHMGTVVSTLRGIKPETLENTHNWQDAQKMSSVKLKYSAQVDMAITIFQRMGISGRLPGQIRNVVYYGLSLLSPDFTPTDHDIEKIILTAAEVILGHDADTYIKLYQQEKVRSVSEIASGVSKKVTLLNKNQ